jgi:HK97 family phage portal protein
MNIFDKKTKTPEFWNVLSGYNFNRATAKEIVQEGFVGNELVYACVSSLAKACATTPLKLMNGDNVVPDTDPIYQMFYDQWNSKQGKTEAMYQLFVNLFLHGKAYTLKKSPIVGFETNELWVLPTQEVMPSQEIVSYFEDPAYYTFTDRSKLYKYFSEELIIMEFYDPSKLQDEQLGLSPIQGVWEVVQASNNRANAEKSLLKNRGISGFISPKASSGDSGAIGFTNNVLKYVRESFSKLSGGAEKFNKVEVIGTASDFTQLGMDANDMKVIEMQLPHVRSVCRALNLPSQLFGDFQSNTYSNYKEANRAMYTNAVLPNVKHFVNQFEKDLFNNINAITGQNYYLRIATEEIEQLNRTTMDILKELPNNISAALLQEMTPEEKRELITTLGLDGKG